ncbi:PH domain-containing protein [Nocardiopsis sp. CNT-189]|uniref:PH domain-containing protein n=1 Tax=Nocardiopsis oceanisediminis TaxID=2816862 RepID=UPI003B33AD70
MSGREEREGAPAEERGTAPGPGEAPPPVAAVGAEDGAAPGGGGAEDGPAEAGGPEEGPGGGDWRKLSPMMLVVAPVTYLKNFIVPLVLMAFGATQNPWALASLFAALAGMAVTGVFTWATFRYQVGDRRLEIRKGLVSRSRRTIPLERIRGVHVTSNLVHRLFGLAVVHIEAAAGGEGSEEGKLDAVGAEEAERLRRLLLHRRAVLRGDAPSAGAAPAGAAAGTAPAGAEAPSAGGTGAEEGGEAAPAPAEQPRETEYFRMPARWYGFGALSVGYLLTPFVALAAVVGLASQVAGDLMERPGAVAAGERALLHYRSLAEGSGLLALAAVAAGVLLLLLVLMPVFAVVAYAVNHWDFRLAGQDDSLVTRRGLFTRQSVALERRRIRGHELIDSPLERVRSAVRLRAIMTGLGGDSTRAVLLPAGPRARVEGIAGEVLGGYTGGLVRHPGAALRRRLVRSVLPFALAAAVAAAAGLYWAAVPAALLALAGIPLGVDRYRALGHGRDAERISVRWGSLRRTQAVLRREAVIGWTWRQTPFQRPAGLAHLTATVGAGSGGYTAVDADLEESVAFAAGVTPEMIRPFLAAPEKAAGPPPRGKGPSPERREPPEEQEPPE